MFPLRSARVAQLVAIALFLVPATRAGPEERSDVKAAGIHVQVGEIFGRVIAADADSVTLELVGQEGTVQISRERLTPQEEYLLRRASMDEGSTDEWRQLADYAGRHDLPLLQIEALRAALRRAEQSDGADAGELRDELAAARDACARSRLEHAQQLREAGELEKAIEHLWRTLVRYENCAAADEARRELAQVQEQYGAEVRRARKIQRERAQLRAQDETLQRVAELIDRGEIRLREGLLELDSFVEATHSFQEALRRFDRAREQLDELAEDSPNQQIDQQIDQEIERLRATLRDDLLRGHLELGHVYVARGDAQSAYAQVGKAAAIDPTDPAIDRLRQTIAASRAQRSARFR